MSITNEAPVGAFRRWLRIHNGYERPATQISEGVAPPPTGVKFTNICPRCGCRWIRARAKTAHMGTSLLLIFIGILLCMTVFGIIPGILLILVGLVIGARTKKTYTCKDCKAKWE